MQLQLLIACSLLSIQLAEGQIANAISPAASSDPKIEVEAVAVDAEGNALVHISFASAGKSITSLQFDITNENQDLALSVIPGTVINAGKNLWEFNVHPAVRRIVIAGLNQIPISDGVLATLSVQVKPETPPGVYPLVISNMLAANGGGYPVPVSGSDGGAVVPGNGTFAPVVLSVANAASYVSGAVAPGEIVVIGGQWLGPKMIDTLQLNSIGSVSTLLAGTRVLFDGIAAPLIYTMQEQLSVVVPYAIDVRSQTSLQVEYQGIRSAPIVLPVTSTSPAIFTLNQSGTGQGVIVNEDGTINGPESPAARGSVISIYGTGEGQTVPPGVDGLIVDASNLRRPLRTATVSIGGQNADVLYLGSAGDQVSGLFQANVRIPLSVTPGGSVPVAIAIDQSSQSGVTIAVQ